MKPYEPYKEEVFLTEPTDDMFAISFRGINYLPTDNATALGVLLFGLRPAGINFKCKSDMAVPMHLAQHAAYILHLHANGDRIMHDGTRRVPLEDLHRWVASAVALAPNAESADWTRKAIDEALGPYAYLDDNQVPTRTLK